MVGSTPLGAGLVREVERMELESPGIFGNSGGAYAQVFSLWTSACAGGVLLGPAWTSFAYGQGWRFLVISLGLLSASVAIPLVRVVHTNTLQGARAP